MTRNLKSESKSKRLFYFYRVIVTLESYKLKPHHTIEDAIEKLKYHL